MKLLPIVLVVFFTAGQADASTGEEVAKIRKAWKSSPGKVTRQFSYAMVAPCSVSVALFTAIAENKSAPDSLRAESYRQLGDYSFVHSAFKTASVKYAKAFALLPRDEFEYLRAKALAALGDTSVRSVLKKLLNSKDADLGNRSRILLASVFMKKGQFDSAYQVLSFTDDLKEPKQYRVSAYMLRRECALQTGDSAAAAMLSEKIAEIETGSKKSNGVASMNKGAAVMIRSNDPHEGSSQKESRYTLQVGAFSSADNANTLKKKLEKRFNEVKILPTTIAETVVYRVRVGSFGSKYEADVFGNDSLASAGYSFRSVEKKK